MSDSIELRHVGVAGWGRLGAYVELTKPRIAVLVLIATAVGFHAALPVGSSLVAGAALIHTLIATALVAAGANILNQYLEVEQDARMVRTAGRPLPTGRVTCSEALVLGSASAGIGVLYLAVMVNALAASLAALTLVSYVFIYTPLKQKTAFCVFVGAIPGALPPVIGWAGGCGSLGMGAWLLFTILFFWQLPHFAAIAWQYRDDYARGGFPLLSVIDPNGQRTQLHLITHTVGLLIVSVLPAMAGMAGPIYAVSAMVLGLAFLASGIVFVIRKTTQAARLHVVASIAYLPLLLAILVIDKTPHF
ncbi:MAG: protoheme IX farnesyltransferase [Planctomycetes bacterium]|nr:protoheme IX farnesyltransferase [Planctomycetota bacterium]